MGGDSAARHLASCGTLIQAGRASLESLLEPQTGSPARRFGNGFALSRRQVIVNTF